MGLRILTNTIIVLLAAASVQSQGSQVLWNNECPYSFGATLEEGKLLQRELADYEHDFKLQLTWQGGEPCRDANEKLKEETALARRVISDVLKPALIPAGPTEDKFLLLQNVAFRRGKEDALVVRFAKDNHIVKVMKTKMKVFITVRPVSGKAVEPRQISEEIFNKRILPAIWEKPLYHGNLKRESKIMRAGTWLPQDNWSIDGNGNLVGKDDHMKSSEGPIGLGFYTAVGFCTDGKFISYMLSGGPPVSRKKAEENEDASN